MKNDIYDILLSIYDKIEFDKIEDKREKFKTITNVMVGYTDITDVDITNFMLIDDVLNDKMFNTLTECITSYDELIRVLLIHYLVKYDESYAYNIIEVFISTFKHLVSTRDNLADVTEDDIFGITKELLKQKSKSENKKIATPALLKLTKIGRMEMKKREDDYDNFDIYDDYEMYQDSKGMYHRRGVNSNDIYRDSNGNFYKTKKLF